MPTIAILSVAEEYLYMLWPLHQKVASPAALPPGYQLRIFQEPDAQAYCDLVNLDDWGDQWRCTSKALQRMIDSALPQGFFVVEHQATGKLVATGIARHHPNAASYYFPYGGEVGLLFVHPEHRGHGLGRILTIIALNRLLQAGYTTIYLNAMDGRLPALHLYLTLGFAPLLYTVDVTTRWQEICAELDHPFTPETWPHMLEP